MLRKMEILKILTCVSVVALASATTAFADSGSSGPYDSKGNPNCTHGDRDCSANYPTSDVSGSAPNKNSPYDPTGNPNCSPGQTGCSANYPTGDQSKANPNKPSK
jgi:hypothetical protein